jgi:hypothetical protein
MRKTKEEMEKERHKERRETKKENMSSTERK